MEICLIHIKRSPNFFINNSSVSKTVADVENVLKIFFRMDASMTKVFQHV